MDTIAYKRIRLMYEENELLKALSSNCIDVLNDKGNY